MCVFILIYCILLKDLQLSENISNRKMCVEYLNKYYPLLNNLFE